VRFRAPLQQRFAHLTQAPCYQQAHPSSLLPAAGIAVPAANRQPAATAQLHQDKKRIRCSSGTVTHAASLLAERAALRSTVTQRRCLRGSGALRSRARAPVLPAGASVAALCPPPPDPVLLDPVSRVSTATVNHLGNSPQEFSSASRQRAARKRSRGAAAQRVHWERVVRLAPRGRPWTGASCVSLTLRPSPSGADSASPPYQREGGVDPKRVHTSR
jgi:hypothetical protein